jgi:predicted nucleic acid-binding protein
MIALDTTALIDILRGKLPLSQICSSNEIYCTTSINLLELQVGLSDKQMQACMQLTESLHILPFTKDCAIKTSEIIQKLSKKGTEIGRFDTMIAACILTHNVTKIITKNQKHFSKISQLDVVAY